MLDKSTILFMFLDIVVGFIFFVTPLPIIGNLLSYVFFIRAVWDVLEDILYSER